MIKSLALNEGYAESQRLRWLTVQHDEGFETAREFLIAFRQKMSEYVEKEKAQGLHNPSIRSLWKDFLKTDLDGADYYNWFQDNGFTLGEFDSTCVKVYRVAEFLFEEEDETHMYGWDLEGTVVLMNEKN